MLYTFRVNEPVQSTCGITFESSPDSILILIMSPLISQCMRCSVWYKEPLFATVLISSRKTCIQEIEY